MALAPIAFGYIAITQKEDTLIENLRSDTAAQRLCNVLTLLKWLSTILIIVLLRGMPGLQLPLLLIQSTLLTSYLLTFRPFQEPSELYLALFNELGSTVSVYLLMLLTDFNTDPAVQDIAGYSLACLLITYLAVACLTFLKQSFLLISKRVRRYIRSKQKLYI